MSKDYFIFAGNYDEYGQREIGMDHYWGTTNNPNDPDLIEELKDFTVVQLAAINEWGDLVIVGYLTFDDISRQWFWEFVENL